MKSINKSIIFFSTTAILLGLLIVSVIRKFQPIFLQKSVYFCEQALHNFSLQIPYSFEAIVALLLLSFFFIASIKTISLIIHSFKLKKILATQISWNHDIKTIAKKLSLENKLVLVEHKQPFAFCFGFLHPKIYLSTGMVSIMNTKELEAILLHENYHFKKRDSITIVVASVTQVFFPFFPLLSDVIQNYKIQREVTADSQVMQQMGSADVFVSVLKKLLQTPVKEFSLVAAIADCETLEPRILAITQHKKPKKSFSMLKIAVSLFSVLLLAMSLLTPVEAVQIHSGKTETTMVCLHNSDCMNWCKTHHTVSPVSSTKMNMNNASYLYTPAM